MHADWWCPSRAPRCARQSGQNDWEWESARELRQHRAWVGPTGAVLHHKVGLRCVRRSIRQVSHVADREAGWLGAQPEVLPAAADVAMFDAGQALKWIWVGRQAVRHAAPR
eukprot:CAMPEP_0181215484 /NCGR_PEP_ID=MMETSP1096-20121128/26041_1 /TAXON_ID=156174 ORGANISM="Chrysochromulina ericina, Strain CCMP281" /NCGR_SAMPLE_ID=MMETSP1096 /ASSEMBLY_ACC=CAM_ASM_000453 /LENGTH=110 /DNA_ID=CAMNT_0023307349 /DNA_START=735 /DNA_END=1063 /DNA_ORIENTATION=-